METEREKYIGYLKNDIPISYLIGEELKDGEYKQLLYPYILPSMKSNFILINLTTLLIKEISHHSIEDLKSNKIGYEINLGFDYSQKDKTKFKLFINTDPNKIKQVSSEEVFRKAKIYEIENKLFEDYTDEMKINVLIFRIIDTMKDFKYESLVFNHTEVENYVIGMNESESEEKRLTNIMPVSVELKESHLQIDFVFNISSLESNDTTHPSFGKEDE